jgi:hypothetical protein
VMKPLMLDGIAECASDRFLACYFVEGLRTPLASDYLIGHKIRFFDLVVASPLC